MSGNERQQPLPYAKKRELAEFDRLAIQFVQEVLKQRMEHLMTSRNALVLRHGRAMEFVREDQSRNRIELNRSLAESVIHHNSLVNNDLEAFRQNLHSIVNQFASQMTTTVYETVSRGATEVGNVISTTGPASLAESFYEMIEKIQFGVDELGLVTRPSIHASPKDLDAMQESITAQGADFEERIKVLTKKKETEALQRDAERRAKFKRHDP